MITGRCRPRCRGLPAALALLAALPRGFGETEESWTVKCSRDCGGVDMCSSLKLCSGSEEQSMICDKADRQPCAQITEQCVPQDCTWNEWSEWVVEPGTGLCNRTRTFNSNSCGGNPCSGHTVSTEFCSAAAKDVAVQDCELDDWNAWEPCKDGQRTRARGVKHGPRNGGQACQGSLGQTEPCGAAGAIVDCKLSDWLQWSGCSNTCGSGHRTRVRAIQEAAKNGGKSCASEDNGPVILEETGACSLQSCSTSDAAVDCELGEWGKWSDCSGFQATRTRAVLKPASFGGKACEESLQETAPCKDAGNTERASKALKKTDCALNEWGSWSLCDKDCGGGQTFRERTVKTAAMNGGAACEEITKETAPCNTHECGMPSEDSGNCALSQWSDWSACSAECGQGTQLRTRKVAMEATQGGVGCSAQLSEVRGCADHKPCSQKDCQWGQWSDWSACSLTCGAGASRTRSRQIVVPPSAGGAQCDVIGSSSEVEPCPLVACERSCTDGAWGRWSDWSSCTATCGGGLAWRHRPVAKQASHCGTAATGNSTEVMGCNTQVCPGEDEDCKPDEWTSWGPCSATCSGVQRRSRRIAVEGKGRGKSCDSMALEEVQSCNGPGDKFPDHEAALLCGFGDPVDCHIGEWSKWTPCSRECDGGQQTRHRSVLKTATNGGKLCSDALQETQACGTKPCQPAQDCVWNDWEDWSKCATCNDEKKRTRSIRSLPTRGGKACASADSTVAQQEVASCDDMPCENKMHYCVWGKWKDLVPCTAECGVATKQRERRLIVVSDPPADASEIVAIVSSEAKDCTDLVMTADGVDGSIQTEEVSCGLKPCTTCKPLDCQLSDWSEWSQPTCSGIVTRSRSVGRAANECGKPCDDALVAAKAALKEGCDPGKDCEFGAWTDWAGCDKDATQEYRSRKLLSDAGVVGAACSGALNQTRSCGEGHTLESVDCELAKWSGWSECSRSCGGGQQEQTREVPRTTEKYGRTVKCKPQEGPVTQTRACNEDSCEAGLGLDCKLGDWNDWQGCDGGVNMQATRTRVVVQEAQGNGRPCAATLAETGACPAVRPADCTLSQWSLWGNCDVSCGGGQQFRVREVTSPARNGGKPCSGPLHETMACSEQPCSAELDCLMGDWAEWSACTTTCGQGVQTRKRVVERGAKPGGAGCSAPLDEVRACSSSATCDNKVDCLWGQWGDWGACQSAQYCGIGHRARQRKLARLPSNGGRLCDPNGAEEIAPSLSCPGKCAGNCVEMEWADWGEWGSCSVTCGSGLRHRTRDVKEEETQCAPPSTGEASEVEGCVGSGGECAPAAEIDCKFSDWGAWEPDQCTSQCHGYRLHRRTILRAPQPGGMACTGPLTESVPCMPAPGEPLPAGCTGGMPKNCELDEWSAWSPCNATCGQGYMLRSREVLVEPQFGGRACENPLKELKACEKKSCAATGSKDCKWTNWGEWTSCNPLTGERSRSRTIDSQKAQNGKECLGPVREFESCSARCEETEQTCGFGVWSEWSPCSKTCGIDGRKTRSRSLELKGPAPVQAATGSVQSKAAVLPTALTDSLEGERANMVLGSTRQTRFMVAFACGSLALLVALGAMRLGRSAAALRRATAAPEASASSVPLAPGGEPSVHAAP